MSGFQQGGESMIGRSAHTLIADVVVVGAGLVGAAIAYGLAKRNFHVLVVDGNLIDPYGRID